MIKCEVNAEEGTVLYENNGTADELLVESLLLVQNLYSHMIHSGKPRLMMVGDKFKSILCECVNDAEFWQMKPDKSIIIDKSEEVPTDE